MTDPLHLGVVASSGGGAMMEMVRILDSACPGSTSYHVVTDRPCGIEAACAERGIPCTRIEDRDNAGFSRKARVHFEEQGGVDAILLFYVRLVSAELYTAYPAFNIHPALLPAFPGLHALERAREKDVRFQGATLHGVTAAADEGPIIAQAVMPLEPGTSDDAMNKRSFIQKVYLSVLLTELLRGDALEIVPGDGVYRLRGPLPHTDRCNPAIADPRLLAEMNRLQAAEGVVVVR